MEYGIWLSNRLPPPGVHPLKSLAQVVETAEKNGYTWMSLGERFEGCIDIEAGLASILHVSGNMHLITAIMLSMQRGIVPTAKFFATMDHFSDGRIKAGIAPGSAYLDSKWVGLDTSRETWWARFDESVEALRTVLTPGAPPFKGKFYNTEAIEKLEPYPVQNPFPIWLGSWGSSVGLRRVARHGDGWLGSAGPGHQTPEQFAKDKAVLEGHLRDAGKDPARFPNACSTMRLFLSEDKAELERMRGGPQVVGEDWGPARPAVRAEDAPSAQNMVGTVSECREKLARWKASGAQALLLAPGHDAKQVERFMNEVAAKV